MVTNMLRLLELHSDVQDLLQSGELEMGHARAIVALPLELQPEIAKRVARIGLSVRETERLVQNSQKQKKNKRSQNNNIQDPNIRKLQDDLSGRLGASVNIKQKTRNKGVLEIRYNSLDELDGILKKIK
jgi:ParB family transcriptional regulator, chromosome partitioning protein